MDFLRPAEPITRRSPSPASHPDRYSARQGTKGRLITRVVPEIEGQRPSGPPPGELPNRRAFSPVLRRKHFPDSDSVDDAQAPVGGKRLSQGGAGAHLGFGRGSPVMDTQRETLVLELDAPHRAETRSQSALQIPDHPIRPPGQSVRRLISLPSMEAKIRCSGHARAAAKVRQAAAADQANRCVRLAGKTPEQSAGFGVQTRKARAHPQGGERAVKIQKQSEVARLPQPPLDHPPSRQQVKWCARFQNLSASRTIVPPLLRPPASRRLSPLPAGFQPAH